MIVMDQTRVSEFDSDMPDGDDWSYEGADTSYMTHGLHSYPARMIPQVAWRLIREYSDVGELVWDPFCGSGTVLVESMLRERQSIGTDLNPFAIFLSRVKTHPIKPEKLQPACASIIKDANDLRANPVENVNIPEMHNIDYWFKDYVKRDLAQLHNLVFSIEENDLQNFFRICLASTARDVSNLKKNEFKIVRMKPSDLDHFMPDVYDSFTHHVRRCRPLMESFVKHLPDKAREPELYDIDNRQAPIDDDSVDVIVTSPPYGDHSTTVAYGQFSRYPGLWAGVEKDRLMTVDRRGLGGSISRVELKYDLDSDALSKTHTAVNQRSEKRAEDLYRFFTELNGSLQAMFDKLRSDARACVVVGNRSMSRVRIPTNIIIKELGEVVGFSHDRTIPRDIPTKRMPWQNAPENVIGEKADTMHNEHIVILQKP